MIEYRNPIQGNKTNVTAAAEEEVMAFFQVLAFQRLTVWERCFSPVMLALPVLCCLLLPVVGRAGILLDTTNDSYSVLTGYGQSFPGWGMTTQRVETIDLVFRHNHHIFDDLGSGWYRGFHSILMELPIHFVVSPDTSAMIGLNFLAAYTFTASDQWQPYIFAGGGPVYSFADVPGMGAEWNGNYQGGIGLEHPINEAHHLLLELRFHHISNGGSKEPNDPLNSVKAMMGFTF